MKRIDLSTIKKTNQSPPKIIEKPQPKIKVNQDSKLEFQPKQPQLQFKKPTKKIAKKEVVKTDIVLSELDRAKKIKLLELYVQDFPDELKKYKKTDFNKCSDSKLVEYKETFDKTLSSSNNLGMIVGASQQFLQVYEMIGKAGLGLQIDGIHKLGYSPEWVKNVKAVCLKYMDDSCVNFSEPENKLAFMLFQNTLMLHYYNTSKSEVESETQAPKVVESKEELSEINEKFSDI